MLGFKYPAPPSWSTALTVPFASPDTIPQPGINPPNPNSIFCTYPHFKLIIFDLDGTLIDSMDIWHQLDIKFLAKRNLTVPEGLFDDLPSNNIYDTAVYFKQRFALPETIEEIIKEWMTEVGHAYEQTIPLKPHARELLAALKQANIPIALGTSNERNLTEAILKRLGIYELFVAIVCGCDCQNGKPAPDIFLKIAKDLQVNPADCLVFEDSLIGVKAAKNAGMTVYAVADDYATDDKEEIKSLADGYFEGFLSFL